MAMRSGQPIPERIANAPKLLFGSDLYFSTYYDLNSDRQNNMSMGSIGWSKIVQYGEFYNLDKETIDDLLYVLIRVDNEFVGHINKKKPDQ